MTFVQRMIRLARERFDQTDPVERLSDADLLARADRVAEKLGVSRAEAFAKLERGELEGTVAGVELYTVKRLLNGSANLMVGPEVNTAS